MQQHDHIVWIEERNTIIAAIVDDLKLYKIQPSANYPWLEKAYGSNVAHQIITMAENQIKEQAK